ncbi:MAG: hypothetical protein LBT79_04050, partial [Elusimicrobiota bacterium]|nr:hypothetical protein [Elusimicrobiota bacterium]
YDFDFVCEHTLDEIEIALNAICFKRNGRLFINDKCKFTLDFVAPPVMIAQEHISDKSILKTKFGDLYLLTPMDCVRDRLAAYYFWNDPQCFQQALLVYKNYTAQIDINIIKNWSIKENFKDKFEEFLKKAILSGK